MNNENYINPILKDRLNLINLEEFKTSEKIEIAQKYLIPELISNIGIKDIIEFPKDILEYIIENFCNKEQGVRELKRLIETVLRKINVLKYSKDLKLDFFINNLKFPYVLTKESIDELLKDKKITKSIYNSMMYV